jgi:hypothetical protein
VPDVPESATYVRRDVRGKSLELQIVSEGSGEMRGVFNDQYAAGRPGWVTVCRSDNSHRVFSHCVLS